MFSSTLAIISFLFTAFVTTHPAAIPGPPQSIQFDETHVNVISLRQPQALSSTSRIRIHSVTAFTTTATSSPRTVSGHRNHNVAVAFNGTTFTPTALKNVTIGDAVTFYFYPHNFSVVQSSFSHPCTPLIGDASQHPIFSGFDYDTTSGISLNKFVVNITSTDPIWLYGYDGNAADGGSVCQRGMAMVISPLTKAAANGENLKAYIKTANAVALNIVGAIVEKAPEKIYGGQKVTLSARQKAHWEARHPQGVLMSTADLNDYGSGTDTNATTNGTKFGGMNGTNTTHVPNFHSGAGRSVNSHVASSALFIVCIAAVFGLGL